MLPLSLLKYLIEDILKFLRIYLPQKLSLPFFVALALKKRRMGCFISLVFVNGGLWIAGVKGMKSGNFGNVNWMARNVQIFICPIKSYGEVCGIVCFGKKQFRLHKQTHTISVEDD